jgi:hypothetical protein
MKRLRLLLLDTNIIIKLFELGIWEDVVEKCDIHIAQSVVQEAQFIVDNEGFCEAIDLSQDVSSKRISVFEVPAHRLSKFKSLFVDAVIEKLDAGELESLVHLFASAEEYQIASSDGVVFRVLAACNRTDQGISLEEMLDAIGFTQKLGQQFGRAFRESWNKKGFASALQGGVLKPAVTPQTCAAIASGNSSH